MSALCKFLTVPLGKIIKNFVKPCLSQSPGKGLITSNETIQILYRCTI